MLDTLAHQIAQWVRETQVSAMGVKSHAGSFYQGYGLHFEQASPNQFIFFADLSGGTDKRYDPLGMLSCGDPAAECVKEIDLLHGNTISKICGALPIAATPTNQGDCPSHFDQLDNVDIVFTRPNPDAQIAGDVLTVPTDYGNVEVYVTSITGYTRMVNIWTTGQITVQ